MEPSQLTQSFPPVKDKVQCVYVPLRELSPDKYADQLFNIRGEIVKLEDATTKGGTPYLKLTISDGTGTININLFDNKDREFDVYWQVKKQGLSVGSQIALHGLTYRKKWLCARYADT